MKNRFRRTFATTLLICWGIFTSQAKANEFRDADIIVYGSTPGGCCAAVAAAREGASVILLEPTGHVGGLNTGGLSHSDSNQCVRSTLKGLFDEWHTSIEKDYATRGVRLPYKVSVKDQAIWTYEPHVAARVTTQMLDKASVEVLTKRYLQSVEKEGTRITGLVTSGGTFTAEVFIDATYEGDLMAAAGVSWTIGRESRAEYGESLAGKQYPKPKMNIEGLDAKGQTLPLITTTDAGPEEQGDKNVMVYSFRLCLTADPENRVPFPKPANYEPARFELLRRYAKAGGRLGFDLYPLPDGKFDGNNSIGGQFSLGLVGGGNGWCEADEKGRAAIWEAHKQYTLELYHFLTTDPAVPQNTRHKYAELGLCKDEFREYDHFSPALYVREGRRMRGMYVLSQQDILEQPEKDDPIVVSSFPIDSHDCQRVALRDGGVINEGTIFPVRKQNPKQGYAYHVPYRSILPKPEECSNLLVPVAFSCTHVGISSIRVEPTWMILGQSAGIAAALAVKEALSVQKLPYPKLRERLLAQQQVLELPVGSTKTSKTIEPTKRETTKNNFTKLAPDLVTPIMTDASPAAGRRVRQVAPEYEGTEVYHVLYLPVDWKPRGRYPVIVEYTGNKFPPGKGSGEVKDANLGYGASGGKGFLWVVMPYVERDRQENAVTWWGDRQATVDYCKTNLPRICEQFGGDLNNVVICGFSRGAIAASYIGLADDEIAGLWKGMFTHDHFDGHRTWNYPESDRPSALVRLSRLKGRPVLVCGQSATKVRDQYLKDHLELANFTFLDVPTNEIFSIPENKVIHPHTDLWMHRDSKYRDTVRNWLAKVVSQE